MNKAELLQAFQYAPNHPLWGAVMQTLANYRERCVILAKDPRLTDKETNQALGGVSVLDDFRAELDTQVKRSRKEED